MLPTLAGEECGRARSAAVNGHACRDPEPPMDFAGQGGDVDDAGLAFSAGIDSAG
jgi:hypothetical protein